MKGPQVMRGYVDSSLDADAFTDDGFLHTGDMARFDEHGAILITGRIKDIIIRKGENVSAKEVEDVLYAHPKIADVAVLGIPDEERGEMVVAFVVPKDPADPPTLRDVREHCKSGRPHDAEDPRAASRSSTSCRATRAARSPKHELRARHRSGLTRGVQVSLTISGFTRLFDGDLRVVLDAARVPKTPASTSSTLPDHVVMGPRTDRYPFGTFPYPGEEPWPEPMTLLAAIAAVTERVRLATGILISPLRPAVLLAKTAATLDAVSHGRLDLGVGIGWQREEYEALGHSVGRPVPDASKISCTLCFALWTDEPPVEFSSPTVQFGPTWCEPRPVQRPIPIWFGVAATARNLALDARAR